MESPAVPQPYETKRAVPLIEGLGDEAKIEPEDDRIRFEIEKVVFLGNSVFSDQELNSHIAFEAGQKISLGDLKRLAQKVTEIYRAEDYILAKAYIPAQTITNGTVEVHIAEGHISDIELRGETLSPNSKVHDYADNLKRHNPVKRKDIERMVMLTNDLSGLQARAILAPVENDPGGVSLIILPERKKYEGRLEINNRGSSSLGPWQTSGQAAVNNLLGYDESLSILHLRTPKLTGQELSLWSLSQKWFLGNDGMQLLVTASRSDSDPGGTASALDFEGQSNSYSITLLYPWLRSREENLYLSLAFDGRNSSSEIFDTEVVDDNVRHLNAELAYNLFHHSGISDAKLTFSKGLDVMNATERGSLKASRPTGKSDAERVMLSLNRYQNISRDYRLVVKSKGQIAFDTVLSSDLFGIGGGKFGRAYDYSTVTGESGYGISAELVRNINLPIKAISNAKVSLFADWGQAYDRAAQSGVRWKGIGSAGLAGSFRAFDTFDVKFDLANPVVQDSIENLDSSTQAFISINYKF